MFIIHINYKKPLDIVDQYVNAHRTYMDAGYKKNYFVASGPKNPRTGGLIISNMKDKEELKNFLKNDPYNINQVADYIIEEFIPVKYHPDFAGFL